ncbi:MAG: hypothetical protein U0T36_11865 [Saprospiraceae bacterium]
MTNLSNSMVFNLASGECGITVPTFGLFYPNITVFEYQPKVQTISTIINSSRYCSSGQTSYRRTFTNAAPTDARVSAINLNCI